MAFITIVHTSENTDGKEIHDFCFSIVETNVILPLIKALGYEYQNRLAAETAPSFRAERARIHQNHLEHCEKTGGNPQQQFIDFPV